MSIKHPYLFALSLIGVALASTSILFFFPDLLTYFQALSGISALMLLLVMLIQAAIMQQQAEILRNQEERYNSDLVIFNYGRPQIFFDDMVGLRLDIILYVFNRSFMGNTIKEIRITLPRFSSMITSLPFAQSLPPGTLTLLQEDHFNFSELTDKINIQEKTYKELRSITEVIHLEIIDVNTRSYLHSVRIEKYDFDGDGRLMKLFKDREELKSRNK